MMIRYLPTDFEEAGNIMLASPGTPLDDNISACTVDERGIAGRAVIPLTHYAGLRGHDNFDLSMTLLKEMTKRATSEFGIRFSMLQSPEKILSVVKTWATDRSQQVCRLVSEGSRSRLPWTPRLPAFICDPAPVFELLEQLKDDDKEYVRRSVANNLNDISRDNPDLVSKVVAKWMKGATRERKKLIRHACRTLLKNGHKQTLDIPGFKPLEIKPTSIDIMTPEIVFGDVLQFTINIESDSKRDQALMIDYIIHHRKANSRTSAKVFKWRTTTLLARNTLVLTKKTCYKKITTRVYYSGLHTIEVKVNSVPVDKADFQLRMP